MVNLLSTLTVEALIADPIMINLLKVKEISDPIKRLIYIVNDKGQVISIRDFRGNIIADDGTYLDALESDASKRWKARFDRTVD
jgi:hypothetical protein